MLLLMLSCQCLFYTIVRKYVQYCAVQNALMWCIYGTISSHSYWKEGSYLSGLPKVPEITYYQGSDYD